MWLSITTIEAQDLLLRLKVADWAHMKKSDRASLHKEWHKKAYPRDWEQKKQVSWSDLDKLLNRG